MDWMNYNHLFYFWTVARHGAVGKASVELHLAPPTISEQLRKLEESLGVKLFERAGRGLRLTDAGKTTFAYADRIFQLGREMTDAARGEIAPETTRLAAGIAQPLSELVAHQLLMPAVRKIKSLRLVCVEDRLEPLLARLALHEIDVVLSDSPLPSAVSVRAYSHLLGRCGVSIVGAASARRKARFPQCVDHSPFLMPGANTRLHQSLETWFASAKVRPTFVGEFSDSALLNLFGEQGAGLFAVPSIIERDVKEKYKVQVLGRIDNVTEEFYAITRERQITHPAIIEILQAALGAKARRGPNSQRKLKSR
jgi:LysR family transcriptional activator of nhaA